MRVVEDGRLPLAGARVRDSLDGDAVDAECGAVGLRDGDVDGAGLSGLVDSALAGRLGRAVHGGQHLGANRGARHPDHAGAVDQADHVWTVGGCDADLDQQVSRVLGVSQLLAAEGEERAGGARGRVEGGLEMPNVVLDRGRLVVLHRLGLASPLGHPHPDLLAVVLEELDEGLGLEERVARHSKYAVGVHLHVGGELAPPGGRLGAERDLQEALQESGVVDARADAFVVLRIAKDQPTRLLVALLWGHDGEVGFHVRGALVLEADKRDGEPVDHRRRPLSHCPVVGVGEQLRSPVDVDPGVDDDDLRRPVQVEATNRRGGDFAREPLVAHQSLERHRAHPACVGDAPELVGESHRLRQPATGDTRDQRVGASEPGARGVRRRGDGA